MRTNNCGRIVARVLGLALLANLAGCILEPIGEGRGGRDHEDHDRHDRGEEHHLDWAGTADARPQWQRP